jgi:serine/threonine-protein phosphatase 4 regulatory subunit 1
LEPKIQKAFVKEIERVGRDTAYFYVRREASLALGALAKVVPEELVSFSLVSVNATVGAIVALTVYI